MSIRKNRGRVENDFSCKLSIAGKVKDGKIKQNKMAAVFLCHVIVM